MKVYVVSVDYRYPDVDGHGYVAGVYSSEEKAKEVVKKCQEQVRNRSDTI